MIAEGRKGLLTKQVLKSISDHLSSRVEYKDVEYSVTIHSSKDDSAYDEITVYPYITVFPNIHHRKECDRRGVAYHVIYFHFPQLFENAVQSVVKIQKNTLSHGTYVYRKYPLTRYRRWVKINDLEV